jgi:hypothetical protein
MDLLIMSRDNIVAKWVNGIFTVLDEVLMPVYFYHSHNVDNWLETRAIDHHRAHSRLLKKALRLKEQDDVNTVISVNAATITDTYWVKSPRSTLTYNDIRFRDDYFSSLALKGDYDSFNRASESKSRRTPELTNTGSFEKCWRLQQGFWWMLKRADHNQLFSEMFTYELGVALSMNMAEYKKGDKYIKTKDFTDNASVNFEPAYSFMKDNEDYIDTLKKLRDLSQDLVPDYVKMIFLDTLVANPDRHTFNFGILRDINSGTILSMAPNFDNNMALISRGYPRNIDRKNDLLIKLFNELMAYDSNLKAYLPVINEEIIKTVLLKLNMRVKSQFIIDFIMNGYKQILLTL